MNRLEIGFFFSDEVNSGLKLGRNEDNLWCPIIFSVIINGNLAQRMIFRENMLNKYFKGSPDASHTIFEINLGEGRIRQKKASFGPEFGSPDFQSTICPF